MALNFRAIVPMAAKATSLAGRRESLGDSSIMANILLIDPSAVAQLAMRGMLQRGHHRLAMVGSADEAWDFVERVVKVDLVFSELIIEGGGLSLAHRFKDDSFRKLLPFVFYSGNADRMAVKSALEMRVQNFLIKPYHEELIYAEIAKATVNPWRARHFEEEKSFCKLMGFPAAGLHKMLEELRVALDVQRAGLEQSAAEQAEQAFREHLSALSAQAEAAGAWGVVECLGGLEELAVQGSWPQLTARLEVVAFAGRIIFHHLNPAVIPEEFQAATAVEAGQSTSSRALWFNAVAERRCPVVTVPQLHSALDALTGCPVVDSAAAAFQMSAIGDPTGIGPLMDVVERDPGLAAQMLIAANQTRSPSDESAGRIDDPQLAVGLLGKVRLVAQARGLVTIPESQLLVSTQFDWPKFWTYQNGVARLARQVCRYMEFHELESIAYTAGLLHDLGKLLFARLQPVGFQAVLEYARLEGVPLREAERKFIGCTTIDLATYWAEKRGLPRPFVNVIRWIETPRQATEDIDLVAVVSLARDFCRHNHVGSCGDPPRTHLPAIVESEEWRVLRDRVFPGFNLRKFELQAHADCHEAKLSLQGSLKSYAMAY